ncbi:putative Beta-1,3-N-Acetylglucosaminyltransferase family protein [Quillaja saponaria]|uniref:Beta-1,3-N-Acetylglucosaminyltransferase family protein n=1 Tax=Quillaja saponaria TaxID=32244 RepID=A0AAD7PVU7_QUISA|nr:putative Beta-1,3-N-Acetylglucosaminyltransferase family protein [Quillaja saponaria]
MAAVILFAFLYLIHRGNGSCSLDNISIGQSKTGATIQNKPEWNVTITNNCICSQLDLKLNCNGFQTIEAVDPSILSNSGGVCLLNNGQPIYGFSSLTFKYAWDTSFSFNPISSQTACS